MAAKVAPKYISPSNIEDIAATIRQDFPGAVSDDGLGGVDILRIAEGLGCRVETVDFDPPTVYAKVERVAGASATDNVRYVIQVARTDTPVRQNFSIAHEIAHIVLHDNGKKQDDTNLFIERRQSPIDYDANELYKETQANMLAAALLMPEDPVRQLWYNTRSVDEIAFAYTVSVEAAYNRLLNLGLLTRD